MSVVSRAVQKLRFGPDRLQEIVGNPPLIALSTGIFGLVCIIASNGRTAGFGFIALSMILALGFEWLVKQKIGLIPSYSLYVCALVLGCSLAVQGAFYHSGFYLPNGQLSLREASASSLQVIWLAATFSFVAAPRLWLCVVLPSGLVLSAQAAFSSHLLGEVLAVVLCASLLIQIAYLVRANRLLYEVIYRDQANILLIDQLTVARVESERLREIAEEANHAKMRFLASASHDLRQPLTALSLYSESLNQVARGSVTKDIADHIDTSVRNLETLFNSLLDLSKLDAGVVQVNLKLVSLQDLMNRLSEEYSEQAQSRQLKLIAIGNDDWLKTDPILFERMVRNLLENALRYTKEGEIKLSWRVVGSQLTIAVSDTGQGIPASERERIFDEYYQISNPGRDRSKGLGIGLAIVRKISDLLNFEIVLESIVGKGSVFRLIGQAAAKPSIRSKDDIVAPYVIDGSLRNKRILLIDDDAEILLAASIMLKLEGCEVEAASNRVEAMSAFAGAKPDAVVADYRLADGDTGLSVLSVLKRKFPDLKGLVLTGDTGPEPLREVLSSGYRILHKPVRASELTGQIRALLGMGSALDSEALSDDPYSLSRSENSTKFDGPGLVLEQRRARYQSGSSS